MDGDCEADADQNAALAFVIPSEAEGSAVRPGPTHTLASSHADFAPEENYSCKGANFYGSALPSPGAWATTQLAQALPPVIPIIDTHIHMFDTRRPGGVPWPATTDTALYKPALPERYARIAGPLGVVGAIVVEASPLVSDNDWVLSRGREPSDPRRHGRRPDSSNTFVSEGPGTIARESSVSGHSVRQSLGSRSGCRREKARLSSRAQDASREGLGAG